MLKIKVKVGIAPKRYVAALAAYRFDSLLELVLALFYDYEKGTQDREEIQRLLDDIGYKNLKDIAPEDMPVIQAYVEQMLPLWKHQQDAEMQSYLLLAAVQRRKLLVFIDDSIIEELHQEILLKETSIITFVDASKISNITFSTL